MTRIFTDAGDSVPVTVIEALPNRVTQLKTVDTDGYRAVQVTMGSRKASRTARPLVGHYAKGETEPGEGMWEFRLGADESTELTAGAEIKVDLFADGQFVDVTGTSRGKGYAGTIKRHHFRGQDATHGNSVSHRVPGSIGQNQSPGRVFKGKKMSGHLGDVRRTIPNLEVVRVDTERNLILVKGGVPGAPGGRVVLRPAVKARSTAE
jgi:large subunit ribosomal protein L3